MKKLGNSGHVPRAGDHAFDPSHRMDWQEIVSWYPIDVVALVRIFLAESIAQQEPLGIGDDRPWWHWDSRRSLDGWLSQR